MKPMLLTAVESLPDNEDWLYEVKYDGFRCILHWSEPVPKLTSRNNKDLTANFPELVQYCVDHYDLFKTHLPLQLDGEIVFLENDYRSNFSIVQSRGRMRTKKTIAEASEKTPCNFIAFDILQHKGKEITQLPLIKRKSLLSELFTIHSQSSPLPDLKRKGVISLIETFTSEKEAWSTVKRHIGEGLIAKKILSPWESGVRSKQWLKKKNWRIVTVILTLFEQVNGYFNGAVYKEGQLKEITTFRHGLKDDEFQTLATFFQSKGELVEKNTWHIPPSICIDIACIGFDGEKLREPRFEAFRFDVNPGTINWLTLQRQLHPIPEQVAITHPDKPVFPAQGIVKEDYLYYLQQVAPYLLPFLGQRCLTAIRYPHGVPGESFYQKNAPDYTPSFIETKLEDSIDYIVCNNLESLLWLGNQLVIEYHIPFQTIDTYKPTEIVFDLDPPSVEHFSLAIEAALRMKAIFDEFNLRSFVKTSGGKGLQIYIPLPKDTVSYEEARVFTEFVCKFLVEQEPHLFTIERLKKNRNNKLYLDYVQHAEGKTIIAPYSTRGNENGYVATPLAWEEVTHQLHPTQFTISTVLERLQANVNPFLDFFQVGEQQEIIPVLSTLKNLVKKK